MIRSSVAAPPGSGRPRARAAVALFDFADVFEDFYPHLGVDRRTFGETWAASGNHKFASVVQERVGDVTWYATSLRPPLPEMTHALGHRVAFVRSPALHRLLWRTFYERSWSWRLRRFYPVFATAASYASAASFGLLRKVARDKPDVMFVQDYSSGKFDVLLALSRLMRVPLVTYHSGSTPDSYTGRWVRRHTLRRADAVVVSGRREAAFLAASFGVDPARCHVVLTPIDDVFRPRPRAEAATRAGLEEGRRYFLFVGRLDDHVKRVTALLRAFARAAAGHEDASIVIAGDGPDAARVRAVAREVLGPRAVLRGWEDDPERLADLYASADALLLPSLREGFPTVVGEALACGTPVLASDVGGISELVADGVTGWLVPPGDDAALEAAIGDALAGTAAAGMRAAARRVAVERVSRDTVGDALQQLFADLLGRPG